MQGLIRPSTWAPLRPIHPAYHLGWLIVRFLDFAPFSHPGQARRNSLKTPSVVIPLKCCMCEHYKIELSMCYFNFITWWRSPNPLCKWSSFSLNAVNFDFPKTMAHSDKYIVVYIYFLEPKDNYFCASYTINKTIIFRLWPRLSVLREKIV